MALDLQNYIIPESKAGGLDKIAEQMQQQKAAQAKAAKDAATQQAVGMRYTTNLLNKTKLFTGTPIDNLHNEKIPSLINQAAELYSKGANEAEVTMALTPEVEAMTQMETNAKNYKQHKIESLALLKGKSGVDLEKVAKAMDDYAFPVDPKTGKPDVANYDPNTNYADLALKEGDVFTNEGLNEFISKEKPITNTKDATLVKKDGGSFRSKVELTHPPIMTAENVNGKIEFVPHYEVATDEGEKLVHSFGEQGDHPVRLLDKGVFESLPPNALGYIRQEVRKLTKDKNIPLDSVQAEYLARAIAYDDIKAIGEKKSSASPLTVSKEAPTDKFYPHWDYQLRNPKAATEDAMQIQGNAYDEIGVVTPVKIFYNEPKKVFGVTTQIPVEGTMVNGVAYDKNGQPLEGKSISISKNDLPTNLIDPLNKNKINVEDNVMFTTGVGGKAEEMQTRSQGKLSRQGLENLQKEEQIKAKTAPKKVFGTRQSAKQAPKTETKSKWDKYKK